jgi:hypothetical protein
MKSSVGNRRIISPYHKPRRLLSVHTWKPHIRDIRRQILIDRRTLQLQVNELETILAHFRSILGAVNNCF